MAVAVVTGGNKGIGFSIGAALCKQFNGVIYLTARNKDLGEAAVKQLNCPAKLRFHQLDITDEASVTTFRDYLKKEYGGLDVLVNNAGIAYKMASTAPFSEQASVTVGTNYFGTRRLCDALFPLLRAHARVVNVASSAGVLGSKYSEAVAARLTSDKLTTDELDALATEFVGCAQDGSHKARGFPEASYGVSKALEIALTGCQQRAFDADARADLVVNACCPGYVATDMSSFKGPLTTEEGAETPVYLALLPAGCDRPKGQFVKTKRVVDWKTGK